MLYLRFEVCQVFKQNRFVFHSDKMSLTIGRTELELRSKTYRRRFGMTTLYMRDNIFSNTLAYYIGKRLIKPYQRYLLIIVV